MDVLAENRSSREASKGGDETLPFRNDIEYCGKVSEVREEERGAELQWGLSRGGIAYSGLGLGTDGFWGSGEISNGWVQEHTYPEHLKGSCIWGNFVRSWGS